MSFLLFFFKDCQSGEAFSKYNPKPKSHKSKDRNVQLHKNKTLLHCQNCSKSNQRYISQAKHISLKEGGAPTNTKKIPNKSAAKGDKGQSAQSHHQLRFVGFTLVIRYVEYLPCAQNRNGTRESKLSRIWNTQKIQNYLYSKRSAHLNHRKIPLLTHLIGKDQNVCQPIMLVYPWCQSLGPVLSVPRVA